MSATGPTLATPDRPARSTARASPGPTPIEFIPVAPVSVFPPGWRRLVTVQLAVFVAIGVIDGNGPGPIALALFAGSIGIGLLTNRIAKFEGTQIASIPRRFAVLVAGVVLPMALFGASLARWSIGEGGVAWAAAVAAISLVLLSASIIAGKRTATLLAVQAGVWAGFACFASGWAGVLTLVLGLPVAGAVFVRQVKLERMAADAAAAAGRVQTRAREILTDYEETGQGWFWETDRRGMLTYLSRAVAEVVGCGVDDLIGHPLSLLFDQAQIGRASCRERVSRVV